MKKIWIAFALFLSFSVVGMGSASAFPAPGTLPPPDMAQLVKDVLHDLVASGTINQKQSDTARDYLKENASDPRKIDPRKMVDDMMNLGLTDKQAKAIIEALRPPKPPGLPASIDEKVKSTLGEMVDSKVITQAQADQVSDYLKKNKPGPLGEDDAAKLLRDLESMGLTEQQAQAIRDKVFRR
ncbi:hypothetical protein [Azotosporobacter soli]|uniref:hypothetical protein n=1 Tax=Azotosporobacter soli TaxID=3055040 RepID=UPI0031FE6831